MGINWITIFYQRHGETQLSSADDTHGIKIALTTGHIKVKAFTTVAAFCKNSIGTFFLAQYKRFVFIHDLN